MSPSIPLLLLAGLRGHLRPLIPIFQSISCAIFVIAGLSDLRRSNSSFQPLDIQDAGKGVRPLIAITEILAGSLLFVPEISAIAAVVLLGLCVGSILLQPSLLRRSSTLPIVCFLLLVIAWSNWHLLDYWHNHTLSLTGWLSGDDN